MPWTATFVADYTQLDQALGKIEVSLGRVEQDSEKLKKSLQRVTSDFDGSKVSQQAQTMAEAVKRVGGVTKLTESEQRKLTATVTEAMAKYRALGTEAPAAVSKLSRELQEAARSGGGLKAMLGEIKTTALGTFVGFVSAQAVIGGLKTAISGVGSVITSAFATNASLEKTTLQFTTLIGDADKAKAHVADLFEFAKATPFETGPIIEASRMMRVFGGEALDTKANLTLIGDAAAATGAPIDQLGMWVGRMYANLQAGKPIGEAAQRLTELGVIGPQARAALESVAAGGGSIETKFKVVQDVLGKFTGAMVAQAGTWDGVMSSLADVVNLTVADAFKGLYETVRDSMGNVVKVLGDDGVTGAMNAVGRSILEAFGSEQTNQVAGMTRAFVSVGEVAVSVAIGITRAWAGVKSAVLGVAMTMAEVEAFKQRIATASPFAPEAAKQEARDATAFADALTRQYEAAVKTADGNSDLILSLRTLRTELGKAGADALAMSTKTAATGTAAAGATGAANTLGTTFGNLGGKVKGARSEYDKWVDSLTKGVVATYYQVNALNAMAMAYDIVADAEARGAGLGVDVGGRSRGLSNLISLGGFAPTDRMAQVGSIGTQISLGGFVGASNQNTVGNYGAGIGVNWAGVPAQLLGAFSGGNIGAGLGSVGGGIGGTALASAFGATTGSVLGSVAPIIGTMVGGIVGKWLGGMFGPSKNAIATKEANARIGTTQQGLLGEYGSVEAISNMGPAGKALAAAWGSKGTQGEAWFNKLYAEFTAQVQRQNEALGEQATKQQKLLSIEQQRSVLVESLVPKWDDVNSLLEKYGISLDSTGQQVQQLGTTQWFTGLINDMETLERAGIDVGGMLVGMSDEISGVVQQSVKFGTEIPENMRPYIEELVKAGLLVDANGEKVTDLAGIKWGAPVETQAEIVTAAIDVMTEAITTLKNELQALADFLATVLPRAAQQGADGIEDAFRGTTIDVDTRGDGDVSTKRAAGAVVTRPERAWIGEGGQPEIVGPVDFMARALYGAMARAGMGGMGGSPIVVDSRIDLNGREVGRQMITIIPEAARRAGVRLAPA